MISNISIFRFKNDLTRPSPMMESLLHALIEPSCWVVVNFCVTSSWKLNLSEWRGQKKKSLFSTVFLLYRRKWLRRTISNIIFFFFLVNSEHNFGGNFIFTTFMVSFFIFTTTKLTFSKIHSSLNDKKLLYLVIYIYNKLLFK